MNEQGSWISRDIKDHSTCTIYEMLQELAYHCRHDPNSNSDCESEGKKKELFRRVLHDVLSICDGPMKREMQDYLSDFVRCDSELSSYKPFVQAANHALLKLRKLKIPGLLNCNDDDSNIIFHHNELPIKQKHKGVESKPQPDVIVVSCENTRDVLEDDAQVSKQKLLPDTGCERPHGRFEWSHVLSTFEFKRTPNHNMKPPNYDQLNVSNAPPNHDIMGAQPVKPTNSRAASIPAESVANELRLSERLRSGQAGNKRPSDSPASNERKSKRVKSNNEEPSDENTEVAMEAMEQNVLYAAEMFVAHVTRQHVLSCVVNNDMIYLWHFDRQNAIQCSGFSFVHDLPSFLTLLFIMQRMPYTRWSYNPLFDLKSGSTNAVEVKYEKTGTMVDLEFDFDSPDRITDYGLCGRATNVFPVKSNTLTSLARGRPSRNNTDELVAKIYWPEESRQSEAEILEEVQNIAAERPKVKDHVPEMIWSHKFEETSTAKIRMALGIDSDAGGGSRALCIIVFRKLRPITELSGDRFLRAWWHAVDCHRVLWECGVRHCDISPSNLMFYCDSSGEVFGVLIDYDFSLLKNIPTKWECVGTIPFVAIELLDEDALEGKVEHLYKHDAESFIWVLTWVCLRYDDGKLLRHGRPLDEWLTVDAIGCRKEKALFQISTRRRMKPSSSHESNWLVAQSCLSTLFNLSWDRRPTLDVEYVFKTCFEDVVPPRVKSV